MADKKTFEIKINGLAESYDGVVKLSDVLNRLGDTTVNVGKAQEDNTSSTKKASEAQDELTKKREQAANYDKQYAEDLARVKKELADNAKEAKNVAQAEADAAIIAKGNTATYRDKQALLSALGRTVKSYVATTDEEKKELQGLMNQYATLNEELKEFDKTLGNHHRNVGNYESGTVSLKKQLKELQAEMQNMLVNGVKPADPAFQELASKAGKIKDAMIDASNEVKAFANDTRGLTDVVNVASTLTAGFGLVQGAMAAFGTENEELQKSMQKLMAVMTVMNSLQTIANNLTKNGTASYRIYHAVLRTIGVEQSKNTVAEVANTTATEANTVATKANSAAKKEMAASTAGATAGVGAMTTSMESGTAIAGTFSRALSGIGKALGWVGIIVTVATVVYSLYEAFKSTTPEIDKNADAIKKNETALNEYTASASRSAGELVGKYKSLQAQWKALRTEHEKRDFLKKNANAFDELGLAGKGVNDVERAMVGNTPAMLKALTARAKAAQALAQIEKNEAERYEALEKARQNTKYKLTKQGETYSVDELRNRGIALTDEQINQDKGNRPSNDPIYGTPTGYFPTRVKLTAAQAAQITAQDSQKASKDYADKAKGINSMFDKRNQVAYRNFETNAETYNSLASGMKLTDPGSNKGGSNSGGGKNAKDDADKIKNLKETVEKTLKSLQDSTSSLILDNSQKELDNQLKALQQGSDNIEFTLDALKDIYSGFETIQERRRDAEIAAITEKYEEEKKKAKEAGEDVSALEEAKQRNITAITEKYKLVIEDLDNKYNVERKKAIVKNNNEITNLYSDNVEDIKKELEKAHKELGGSTSYNKYGLINLKETRKNLTEVQKHYENTLKAIQAEMKLYSDQGIKELGRIKATFGEDSEEYKKAEEQFKRLMQTMAQAANTAQKGIEKAKENQKKSLEDFFDNLNKKAQQIAQDLNQFVVGPVFDTFNALLDAQMEELQNRLDEVSNEYDEINKKREDTQSRIEDLNQRIRDDRTANVENLKKTLADEQQLLAQQAKREKKLAKEKEQLEKEQAEKEKQQRKVDFAQKLIEGLVNTALGVTAALTRTPPMSFVLAGIVGAMGAIQTGIIASQMGKLADGGLLVGPSHSNGGMKIQGSNVEVEGGEFVMNKRSTAKYLPLLNAINAEGNGGKNLPNAVMGKYADGGQLDFGSAVANAEGANTERQIARNLANIDFNPVVSVVDIIDTQKNLVRVQDLAGAR